MWCDPAPFASIISLYISSKFSTHFLPTPCILFTIFRAILIPSGIVFGFAIANRTFKNSPGGCLLAVLIMYCYQPTFGDSQFHHSLPQVWIMLCILQIVFLTIHQLQSIKNHSKTKERAAN